MCVCVSHKHTEQPRNEHIDLVQQRKRTNLHVLIVSSSLLFLCPSLVAAAPVCFSFHVSPYFFIYSPLLVAFCFTYSHLLTLFTHINYR